MFVVRFFREERWKSSENRSPITVRVTRLEREVCCGPDTWNKTMLKWQCHEIFVLMLFFKNQTDLCPCEKGYILLAKCLKNCSFFAFAFKVWKKCYYDQKKNFVKNINRSMKKCKFQIRWCRLSKMLLKKLKAKNHAKNAQKRKFQNSHSFDTHIDIFHTKNFWGPISSRSRINNR